MKQKSRKFSKNNKEMTINVRKYYLLIKLIPMQDFKL